MTILHRTGAAIAAFFLCLGTPAVARQPARLPGSFITGQVLSANNNSPLRRVRIDVARGTWSAEPMLTDNDGRFAIDLERAGPVTVTATKGGYLVAKTTVKQEDLSRPVLIRLPRGAVIAGTVLDEQGQPAVGTSVQVKRLDPAVDGFPQQSSTITDDRGEYRLAGLAPGKYEVTAGIDIVLSKLPLPPNPGVAVTVAAGDQIGGVQLIVPDSRTVQGQMRALSVTTAPARAPAQGPGGVRGRVLNDVRKPIPFTTVRISGPGINRSMQTDADGGFSITGLRPGRYSLETTRATGTLATWRYGQEAAGDAGTPIVVADRVEEGLDLILPRSLALQGVIVDERGEPVQGARVQALQVDYSAGRLMAVPAANERRTDDQGSYRIWGLAPATYLLSASLDGLFRDDRGAPTAYAPIYYPGTPLVAAASPIDLRDDSTINFVFAPVALTQIAGKADDGDGPLVAGTVRLVESRRPGVTSTTPRTVSINGDGSFIIRNVPPGDYVLHVRGDGPGRTGLFATQTVSVGSDPIDLRVRTSHGMSLEGRAVLEGVPEYATSTAALAIVDGGIRIGTDITRSNFSVSPVALDDHARADATMVFGWSTNEFFGLGLFGRLSFELRNAPDENWYIKSFTINGTDIADSGFDFGSQPGTISDAEIVLSHNGASVSGRREDGGTPVGYYVVVFPASRDGLLPPSSRRLKYTHSATDGSFRVAGLPAGDYLVAAVSRLQGGEWQNPELLQKLAPRAERVTLSEGQSATLSLRLIER